MKGVRLAIRWLGTLLMLAPLAWVCVLLASDLHQRPDGRVPLKAEGELRQGRSISIPLPPDRVPYRGVGLRFAAARPTGLLLELCDRAGCEQRSLQVDNGTTAVLPVPADATQGGLLLLHAVEVQGGPVSLEGDAATPAIELVQGHSWRVPARRARELFAALAGHDLFVPMLIGYAGALALTLVAAMLLAVATARDARRSAE